MYSKLQVEDKSCLKNTKIAKTRRWVFVGHLFVKITRDLKGPRFFVRIDFMQICVSRFAVACCNALEKTRRRVQRRAV